MHRIDAYTTTHQQGLYRDKNMIRPFFIALQFLTRLPVRISSAPDEISVAYSLGYYPLVGLIIGAILTSAAWVLSAGLLLLVWVFITGGLYLDGLADSMDAWVGGLGDREKTLAIMKDPYCGPAGVVSIVLLLLLKFVALHTIMESGNLTIILLAPLFGRAVLLPLFLTTPYVRSNGLGTPISSCLPRKLILIIFIATLAGVFFLVGINCLWLMLMMMLFFCAHDF